MYTLYYKPFACSLATHTVLNILQQPVTLKLKDNIENFTDINPTNAVPVIQDGNTTLTEGIAILLYLLEKHDNTLLPKDPVERQTAIQNMLFANATMHPAYNRLFFSSTNINNEEVKLSFFNSASAAINQLWQVVEKKLQNGPYLGGEQISPADILLTVYSNWGQYFPVDIQIGEKTQKMIRLVESTDAFQRALTEEKLHAGI